MPRGTAKIGCSATVPKARSATLKEDGFKLYAVKTGGRWKLYTDGARNVSAYCPHIMKELALAAIPNQTLLIGEGNIYQSGRSELGAAQKVFQLHDPQKAVDRQKQIGLVRYMIFYIGFWDGKSLFNEPYHCQVAKITSVFGDKKYKHLSPVRVLKGKLSKAQEFVRRHGHEGLVLYDSDFTSSYRLDGKDPERVSGCYKWKPEDEDDFIVYQTVSSEKNPGTVKEVILAQIEEGSGNLIDCGRYGAFTQEVRREIKTKYLLVLRLNFTRRFPSGKLREPRNPIFRSDKPPSQCKTTRNFPDAKYLDKLCFF